MEGMVALMRKYVSSEEGGGRTEVGDGVKESHIGSSYCRVTNFSSERHYRHVYTV